jgi:hypothetical protein
MINIDSSSELINYIPTLIREWFTLNPAEPFKTGVKVASIAGTLVTIVTTLSTKTGPWLAAKIKTRSISRHLGPEFTVVGIHRSIRYYIRALCQDLDPAGSEEPRLVFGVQQKLFEALDKALTHPTEHNFIILLADSGMGKTSALINYYARHLRRFRKPFNLFLIPLGIPDADERIAKITDRAGSVLFLDALDEDTLAMVDHAERLRTLLSLTRDFERVLISCRTQFFSKDEEIPKETGKIKVSSRAAGESAEYYFHKIYLSPFNDNQVAIYLKSRYPIWRYRRRRKAYAIVKKIPNLTVRPMLLAHVDDIVQSDRDIQYSYQLYEEMIDAWLKREQGFIQKADDLRQFSERLAVDLYLNRRSRGSERIERAKLVTLAQDWGIQLEDWKLSTRSLLNRDADGNYKFAHRSIMEYLFIKRFLKGETKCLDVEWTDQMIDFYMEILEDNSSEIVKYPLQLLVESGHEGTLELGKSPGRKFLSLVLTESQSNNPGRRNRALSFLAQLCFETLNPWRHEVFISINLTQETGTSRPSSGDVQSDVFVNVIEVYSSPRMASPEVRINKYLQPFREHFSEILILGDVFQTPIELNGKLIGSMVVRFKQGENIATEKRWVLLKQLLNPQELMGENLFAKVVFTDEAKQVLHTAVNIANPNNALPHTPLSLLIALLAVNRSLFAETFSLGPPQIVQLMRRFNSILHVTSVRKAKDEQSLIRLAQFSAELQEILSRARVESTLDHAESIEWHHLLLALLHENDPKVVEVGIDYGINYFIAKAFFENRRTELTD